MSRRDDVVVDVREQYATNYTHKKGVVDIIKIGEYTFKLDGIDDRGAVNVFPIQVLKPNGQTYNINNPEVLTWGRSHYADENPTSFTYVTPVTGIETKYMGSQSDPLYNQIKMVYERQGKLTPASPQQKESIGDAVGKFIYGPDYLGSGAMQQTDYLGSSATKQLEVSSFYSPMVVRSESIFGMYKGYIGTACLCAIGAAMLYKANKNPDKDLEEYMKRQKQENLMKMKEAAAAVELQRAEMKRREADGEAETQKVVIEKAQRVQSVLKERQKELLERDTNYRKASSKQLLKDLEKERAIDAIIQGNGDTGRIKIGGIKIGGEIIKSSGQVLREGVKQGGEIVKQGLVSSADVAGKGLVAAGSIVAGAGKNVTDVAKSVQRGISSNIDTAKRAEAPIMQAELRREKNILQDERERRELDQKALSEAEQNKIIREKMDIAEEEGKQERRLEAAVAKVPDLGEETKQRKQEKAEREAQLAEEQAEYEKEEAKQRIESEKQKQKERNIAESKKIEGIQKMLTEFGTDKPKTVEEKELIEMKRASERSWEAEQKRIKDAKKRELLEKALESKSKVGDITTEVTSSTGDTDVPVFRENIGRGGTSTLTQEKRPLLSKKEEGYGSGEETELRDIDPKEKEGYLLSDNPTVPELRIEDEPKDETVVLEEPTPKDKPKIELLTSEEDVKKEKEDIEKMPLPTDEENERVKQLTIKEELARAAKQKADKEEYERQLAESKKKEEEESERIGEFKDAKDVIREAELAKKTTTRDIKALESGSGKLDRKTIDIVYANLKKTNKLLSEAEKYKLSKRATKEQKAKYESNKVLESKFPEFFLSDIFNDHPSVIRTMSSQVLTTKKMPFTDIPISKYIASATFGKGNKPSALAEKREGTLKKIMMYRSSDLIPLDKKELDSFETYLKNSVSPEATFNVKGYDIYRAGERNDYHNAIIKRFKRKMLAKITYMKGLLE